MKTTEENVGVIHQPATTMPKKNEKRGMIKREILVRDLIIWKPKALVFCSGFGMTSEGLKLAGYDVIGVIDVNADVELVYKANFKGVKYLRVSLREVSAEMICEYFDIKPGSLSLIQISNPCTSVSTLVVSSQFSEINDLFFVATTLALNIHDLVGCPAIVYENVVGLTRSDNEILLGMLYAYLRKYASDHFVSARILNAYIHGDAQSRDRVFIQVIHKSLGVPTWPTPIDPDKRKHISDIIPEAKYIVSRNFGKRSYYPNEPAPTITGHPDIKVYLGDNQYRDLVAIEGAQFMGLNIDFNLLSLAIHKQLLGIGNGVCVQVMKRLAECIKYKLLGVEAPEEFVAAKVDLSTTDATDAEESFDDTSAGYVVYEGKSLIDGGNIVAVMIMESNNVKTGNMSSLYILNADMAPIEAVKSGADESICGDCSLRKINKNVCYVNVGLAPTSVWNAWKKGNYQKLHTDNYNVFSNRPVRLGAYGDPHAVPFPILEAIHKHAPHCTSYTHQWRIASTEMQSISMASVESSEEYLEATGLGWRTFRITSNGNQIMDNEIMCPNTTRGIKCTDCRLCNGASTTAKNIVIEAHGRKKSNFQNELIKEVDQLEIPSVTHIPEFLSEVSEPYYDTCTATTPKIISAKQLMEMNFKSLPFQAKWLHFLGEPAANFHAVVFGLPGHGKSTFAVQFASYLANTFGPVLYVSGEEGFSLTFRKKFEAVNIDNIDVADLKNFEEMRDTVNLDHYKFLVIDSLNTMKIDAVQLRAIKEMFKGAGIITISQSTKDGNLRGSNEINHDGDITIEVKKGVAVTGKNRFNKGGMTYNVFKA